jgi:hypothetical protein
MIVERTYAGQEARQEGFNHAGIAVEWVNPYYRATLLDGKIIEAFREADMIWLIDHA